MEMNINLHINGKPAEHIMWLMNNGLAASKTEAVRMAIVRSMETSPGHRSKDVENFNQTIMESVWNNPKDEEAGKFYERRYLRGKKA